MTSPRCRAAPTPRVKQHRIGIPDPRLAPFLDDLAHMVAAQLLAEHQRRARAANERKAAT